MKTAIKSLRQSKTTKTTSISRVLSICTDVSSPGTRKKAHIRSEQLKSARSKELFEIYPEQEAEFYILIEDVFDSKILSILRSDFMILLKAVSCEFQISCALFYKFIDITRKPIWLWSRTLNKVERNYFVSESKEWRHSPHIWTAENLKSVRVNHA